MTLYYAASTNGFYDSDIHGENIPGDAVEISADLHQQLFTNQTLGQLITSDENGQPINTDAPPFAPSPLQQIKILEMSITQRMVQEAAVGSTLTGLGPDKTLTSAQFIASVHTQIATLRDQL